MTHLTRDNFCHQLLTRDPLASELYQEHLADYDEELAHVFLGAWAASLAKRYRTNLSYAIPSTVAEFLEEATTSEDPAVQNLVELSFYENIGDQEDILDRLAKDLLPHSRSRLAHWASFYK